MRGVLTVLLPGGILRAAGVLRDGIPDGTIPAAAPRVSR
jgi:hypothetical protein